MSELLEHEASNIAPPEAISGLSPAQFARAHRLTINYVYLLIWNGKVQAKKAHGRWFITSRTVEDRRRA
jgi:hypothetical protein